MNTFLADVLFNSMHIFYQIYIYRGNIITCSPFLLIWNTKVIQLIDWTAFSFWTFAMPSKLHFNINLWWSSTTVVIIIREKLMWSFHIYLL